MIQLPLANASDSQKSLARLDDHYRDNFISAEKKPYLTRLKESQGPFLGVESAAEGEDAAYILDAASQIATLGLGFSPSSFMGTGHVQESWSNRGDTPAVQGLRDALASFFKRMTGWEHLTMLLCHSGAEANERALGLCHARRISSRADKILAFEGSFHGRTLVSLSCTWSRQKREPFQWPEARTVFCPWPESVSGETFFPVPQQWHRTWEDAPSGSFTPPDGEGNEIACLLKVREQLLTGEFFAIIVEPMQSEGGDRYGSNCFHLGLMLMSRAFRVPIVYDEVQTGFHLGREFFWYRQFELRDREGNQLRPDFVVCSKKAQLGMVLSPHKIKWRPLEDEEEFSVASLSRGLIHGLVLDQYRDDILTMEKMVKNKLFPLFDRYDQFIENPRGQGFCFAFDIHSDQGEEQDKKWVAEFVRLRFERGLLFYPAGERTLRFRLNLAFSPQDVDFLFDQLDGLCRSIFLSEEVDVPTVVTTPGRNSDENYRRCATLLKKKLSGLKGNAAGKAWETLKREAREQFDADLIRFDKKNFASYRQEIEQLQKDTYEPARQTSMELFERSAEHTDSFCLGMVKGKNLGAIVFSGPPSLFERLSGIEGDSCLEEKGALYSMDTTVQKQFHGLGMGQFLKYAQFLLACERGAKLLFGKNRDRLARGMIKLNLSLGARERKYLRHNYDDQEEYRDSIYYHCPLQWEPPPLNLSRRITAPCEDMDEDFIEAQMPSLINKVCLSNFVSGRFLSLMRDIAAPLPESLQHVYSASGQSECVDKIAKSLWYNSKKSHRMMTFQNNFFGNGTFLSRSLHGQGEPFFPVDILPWPEEGNHKDILERVQKSLSEQDYAGIWIEPVTQRGMRFAPMDFLCSLREVCHRHKVPLIYNETASSGYVYESSHYFVSSNPELTPDAGLVYLGGQAGMVFCREGIWVPDKLKMISTWDGDEFSFGNYHRSMQTILQNSQRYHSDTKRFEKALRNVVSGYPVEEISLCRGRGRLKGTFPVSIQKWFECRDGYFFVDPSYCQMKRFLAEYGE